MWTAIPHGQAHRPAVHRRGEARVVDPAPAAQSSSAAAHRHAMWTRLPHGGGEHLTGGFDHGRLRHLASRRR
jgi:hypothetical protein